MIEVPASVPNRSDFKAFAQGFPGLTRSSASSGFPSSDRSSRLALGFSLALKVSSISCLTSCKLSAALLIIWQTRLQINKPELSEQLILIFAADWMISVKFAAFFPKMKIFSFTVQSEEHVKHFEPLSTNFFGVSAIRNGILCCLRCAKMSGTSPENPRPLFSPEN